LDRGLFIGGNQQALLESLRYYWQERSCSSICNEMKDSALSVCYFGDHLENDVKVAKSILNWRTVAIVEELEYLEMICDYQDQRKEDRLSVLTKNSKYWGSFFFSGESDDRKLTFWAAELIRHSDLYVPSLERISKFETDHVYSWKHPSHFPTIRIVK